VEGRNCKLKIVNCKLKMIYLGAVFAAIRGRIMLRPCMPCHTWARLERAPTPFFGSLNLTAYPADFLLTTHYSLLTTKHTSYGQTIPVKSQT
jgi:hypothetical protein